MKVDELLDVLTQMKKDDMGEYDIAVAFRWKGDTVMSDITSWYLNGNCIQLNEKDFERIAGEIYPPRPDKKYTNY
tara:strand:- start:32171 stop:32395 length:225 start_codon:yes stop_codon:yes gene_type:complete